MRPVSAPSHREPPAKRKLDAADRRDAHLVALAMDHERACVPGMLLEPFGPRPAHIVQLRPVAIRQISHASTPRPPQSRLAFKPMLSGKNGCKAVANGFIRGGSARFSTSRLIDGGWRANAAARPCERLCETPIIG